MPTVASLEALERAAAEFEIGDTRLVIEPPALTEARRSLDSSGLLLLGEVHGVRENPLVIRALMLALGLTGLALEWPDALAPAMRGYLGGRPLADDLALWSGDGRITAGHLAVLRERAAAGSLDLTLFDGSSGRTGAGHSATRRWPNGSWPAPPPLPARWPWRQRAYAHLADVPGPAARRVPGPAAAGGQEHPHQVRQRPVLQPRAAPVQAAGQRQAQPGPAAPAARAPCPRPAGRQRGDCPAAAGPDTDSAADRRHPAGRDAWGYTILNM